MIQGMRATPDARRCWRHHLEVSHWHVLAPALRHHDHSGFSRQGHWSPAPPGWREVAAYVTDWLEDAGRPPKAGTAVPQGRA